MNYTKNILITGGAGFIGSHLVRLMLNKYPNYRIVNLDKLTYAGGGSHGRHGTDEEVLVEVRSYSSNKRCERRGQGETYCSLWWGWVVEVVLG